MKIRLTAILFILSSYLYSQPVALQVFESNMYLNMTDYTSYKYDYDDLGNLIMEKEYEGFYFEDLVSVTDYGYEGSSLFSKDYTYFDSDGGISYTRKIGTISGDQECSRTFFAEGYFGVCDDNASIELPIEYIEGCENGWIDFLNPYCIPYSHLTKWTRKSERKGDLVKIIDTVHCVFYTSYTKVYFNERTFIEGLLTRSYTNMHDVIGHHLENYFYDEYKNITKRTYQRYLYDELVESRIWETQNIYENDLLKETYQGDYRTSYFYDQEDRLIKTVGENIKYPQGQRTIKYYTYANKFNVSDPIENQITVFPNPVNNFLYLSLPLIALEEIRIYTQHGQQVSNFHIDNNFLTVSNLPSGIYFLSAKSGEKQYYTKFIKI